MNRTTFNRIVHNISGKEISFLTLDDTMDVMHHAYGIAQSIKRTQNLARPEEKEGSRAAYDNRRILEAIERNYTIREILDLC